CGVPGRTDGERGHHRRCHPLRARLSAGRGVQGPALVMTAAMQDTGGIVRRVVVDELRANQITATDPPAQVTDDLVLGSGGLRISSPLLLHIFVTLEAALRS